MYASTQGEVLSNGSESGQSESDSAYERLASTNLGRIAFNGDDSPIIFPVRYAIDGAAIVFRACPTLRGQMERCEALTFQADGYDAQLSVAWSVCVKGTMDQMPNSGSLDTPVGFLSADEGPWTRSEASHWVRVVPQSITQIESEAALII